LVLLPQYYSGDQNERNEMSGACSRYGVRRGVYRILVEKPVGKRPLGRPGSGWEYNITMDFSKWGGRHGLD
jgi:hypothetical protein